MTGTQEEFKRNLGLTVSVSIGDIYISKIALKANP